MCDLCESDCGNYDEANGFCGHGIAREKEDEYIIKIAEAYRRGRRKVAIQLLKEVTNPDPKDKIE